jgi:hypothetical protein
VVVHKEEEVMGEDLVEAMDFEEEVQVVVVVQVVEEGLEVLTGVEDLEELEVVKRL